MKSKSLLDRTFRYTPAHSTDIRKTFAKERKRLAAERRQQAQVVPIGKKVGK